MSQRRSSSGFTLLELIIALSLSSIVLIGVFSIMTSMVQNEVMQYRKGTVNAWSLTSITAMNQEIENASVLAYPSGAGSTGSALVVCSNWSRIKSPPNGSAISGTVNPNVYYYCYDAVNYDLRRMVQLNTACPNPGAPPACSAGGMGADSVIATGVYPNTAASNTIPGDAVFQNDPNMAGTVHLSFTIGTPTQGVVQGGNGQTTLNNPQSQTFDTRLTLEQKPTGSADTGD